MGDVLADYKNIAEHGATEKERRIGRNISAILGSQVGTGAEPVSFEVIVGALPKDELFPLSKELTDNLKEYWKGVEEYEAGHPKPEDKILEWYKGVHEEVDSKFEKQLNRVHEISDLLTQKKQEVFNDLAERFRETLITVRNFALCNLTLAKYFQAKKVQEKHPDIQDKEVDTMLAGYFNDVMHYSSRFIKSKGSKQVNQGLEELDKKFPAILAKMRKAYPEKIDIPIDMMTGKMGCNYFFGPEDFWRNFDHRLAPNEPGSNYIEVGRGENIHFDIAGGLMSGFYELSQRSYLELKGTENPNYSIMESFSPLVMKISLPETYKELVGAIFDDIKKDYSDRIVQKDDVQKWESK
ncbi:hypothetical protein ACFL6I_19495 [candidate division KSB1 bacterium]